MRMQRILPAVQKIVVLSAISLTALVRPEVASADLSSQVRFDIAAQQLPTALLKYSEQSGVQVASLGEIMEGKASAGVVGTYEARGALERLLAGTGLEFEVIDGNTVAIRAAGSTASLSDSPVPVRGEGQGVRVAQATGDEGKSKGFWQRLKLAQADSTSSENQKTDSKPSVSEETEGNKLTEIVVTAQRRSEDLADVPISISVLGGEQLDQTSTGLLEALRAAPGVEINEDQFSGGTMVSLRGVSNATPRNGGAAPVAFYVDSVPFGFARSAIFPEIPAYDLERVEVLSGPQGTLYGANALSGVVRVLTHDADPGKFELKARTSYSATEGGGQNRGGDVAVNVPLVEGRLAVRATAGFRNDSGWIDVCGPPVAGPPPCTGVIRRDVNDSETENYRLKVHAEPTDSLSIDVLGWWMDSEDGAPSLSRDDGTITATRPQPQTAAFDVYGLRLVQTFDALSITSMTSYMDYEASGVVDGSPTVPAGVANFTLNNFPTATMFSQELNLASNGDGLWRWSAGLFYRDTEEHLLRFANPFAGGSIIQDDFTDFSESLAVYGEAARRFMDNRLELAAGLRYFRDEQETRLDKLYTGTFTLPAGSTFPATSEATTPRVVLTYTPNPDFMAYASYSQGFRSGFSQLPSVQVLFPNFTPAEPDRLTNYEIGAKGSLLDGRVAFEGSVFYVDWQDIQQSLRVPTPIGSVFLNAVVNGAAASGPGASFALSARPAENFTIGANVSWNDLRLDEDVISGGAVLFRAGTRLQFSPEYTAGAFAEYSWGLGGGFTARANVSANYKSAQNTDLPNPPTSVLPTDDLLFSAAKLALETPDEHWTLTLFVNNLSDEYGASSRGNSPDFSLRSRPRTIGLQLEAHF